MSEMRENIQNISIEEEMRESFLDYSMSVIVSRALPDVRDGLKPVHRRILYAMYNGGYRSNRAHSKSARIVGDVLGKFHPHGDQAVYDALVRMAQEWSMRYQLVDGQGNFGSIDGDPPASMRYTEARMRAIAEITLTDIEKDTVDFVPNYDGKELEPMVLPASIPNLLVNGSQGIAVGMATNIPPHNLGEVVDGLVKLIDNPRASLEEIMESMVGPDFPTGGYILGRAGIKQAYQTGRGKVIMRAKCGTEALKNGKDAIIVNELPYQVNKANLVRDIAKLVSLKKLTGITEIRDESDRDGMRVVIELRRGEDSRVVLNNLYKHTNLQATFGIILLAIVNNQPRYLSLLKIMQHFIAHRREVLLRGTRFDLGKAQDRYHIVEGLLIALTNIDEVVRIIRESSDTDNARESLRSTFDLSKRQADAILEMRLRTLTALEVNKLEDEKKELLATIAELESILASVEKQYRIIKEDLLAQKKKFGDTRRTEIREDEGEIDVEDLIPIERMVVTITNQGYIKRTDVNLYRKQKRGGKGTMGADMKEEDWIEHLFVGTTHQYVMFFTSFGKAYWQKIWELPQGGRSAKGRPIVNMLNLEKDEIIEAVVPVQEFREDQFLFFCTRSGKIQKNPLSLYKNPRRDGIKAMNVAEGDQLVTVRLCDENQELLLATHHGMAIRFPESAVRSAGRFTTGVRGINLSEGDYVVGMEALRPDCSILTVTEKGMGKRSMADTYRITNRGGKGVINMKITERSGNIVGINEVIDSDEMICITNRGQSIRFQVNNIRTTGRNTQGVTIFNLPEGERISAVSRMAEEDDEEKGLNGELSADGETSPPDDATPGGEEE